MKRCLLIVVAAALVEVSHCQEKDELFSDEDGQEEDDVLPLDDEEEEEIIGTVSQGDMHALHDHFDGNKDGLVALDEIVSFHRNSREDMVAREVEDLYGEILKDKGGHISFQDYLVAAKLESVKAKEREVEAQKFAVADVNEDGQLDKAELVHLMEPASHPKLHDIHVNLLIEDNDDDNDGKISRKEWVDMEEDYHFGIAFDGVDTNKDGFLDNGELKHYEDEGRIRIGMQSLLADADKNGDSLFSKEEFGNVAHLVDDHILGDSFYEWLTHHGLKDEF